MIYHNYQNHNDKCVSKRRDTISRGRAHKSTCTALAPTHYFRICRMADEKHFGDEDPLVQPMNPTKDKAGRGRCTLFWVTRVVAGAAVVLLAVAVVLAFNEAHNARVRTYDLELRLLRLQNAFDSQKADFVLILVQLISLL